jgi:PqqD family protein of HPr-rel-A system
MPLRYAPTCASLAIRRLDEEVLVFNPAGGSTHLLSEAALEVLQGLLETPAPTDSRTLGLALLGEASAAELQDLERMLQEFARLGLAEARPS